MSPLFRIAKEKDASKKQKFIDPGMANEPSSNIEVISSGENNNNNNNNNNNETFVYNSLPKQNVSNINDVNDYQNNNFDNNLQQQMEPSSEELLMPKNVQPPKLKNENAVEELDLPEKNIEKLDEVEPLEENKVELDPLNNATNPVPVNPVAPKEEIVEEEELPEDVKANLFATVGMMIGMILAPGTTVINNSKKYKSVSKALIVTLWISVLSIILCMAARIIVGIFGVTYNSVTGASSVKLSFVNVFNLDNYTPYLLVAFIMSFGAICVASLVYYASSFLNSKGVHMGTYFMVSSLAMVPVIIGVLVLYPIVNIFSQYGAILVFVFTFLYTLISFFLGMNEVLTFGNINRRILYNVINLSLIFMIIVIIFLLCYRLNILIPPEFHI